MGGYMMPSFLPLTSTGLAEEIFLVSAIIAAGYFGILYFRLKRKTKQVVSSDKVGDAGRQSQDNQNVMHEDSGDSEIIRKYRERLEIAVDTIMTDKLYLRQGFSPKIASDHFKMPVNLFLDDFEKIIGEKFFDFINRLRMEEAAELLSSHPQYTIEAIGKMCGIESRQHFHRLFSKYYGMTPAAWRNR